MVRGFVKQEQVRIHEQQSGQRDTHEPTTAERRQRLMNVFSGKANAVQNGFCACLEPIFVEIFEFTENTSVVSELIFSGITFLKISFVVVFEKIEFFEPPIKTQGFF